MKSINPATGKIIASFNETPKTNINRIIEGVNQQWHSWKMTSFQHRAELFVKLADLLQDSKDECASLIMNEMGKVKHEALQEIDKCSMICRFYAEHAESMLQDEIIATDYYKSLITFQPLGVILQIMPWNFPFWQVFRFTAPVMMAGNTVLLKHASNVCGCSLKIEQLFQQAGFPENSFRSLIIRASSVRDVLADPAVKGVSLTGSWQAGSSVASIAGKYLKKAVLELGGADPFIVLSDANLDRCIFTSVKARTVNAGQACIAAKRFIVVKDRLKSFVERQKASMEALVTGNPADPATDMGPMARKDLLEEVHDQVMKSISMGAELVTGGKIMERDGFYYAPTLLNHVRKGMPVFDEETFGPVSSVIPVENETEAISIANDTKFGLGGSIWTENNELGEKLARLLESGMVVINNKTASNPMLPFGGTKQSGFGRELSHYGLKEFVNIKTICINK